MNKKRILIVEDEVSFRQVVKFKLNEAGYDVILAHNGIEGYKSFTEALPDMVITDLAMPEMTGLELTERIKTIAPEIPVIVITAFGDIQTAVAAMKLGAADYLTKPLNWDELLISIRRALEVKDLVNENRTLRAFISEQFHIDNMIGNSKKMRETYDIVARVARTEITTLILGESGTGKELIAKAIHHNSRRHNKPFITINCSTIPEQLLESELFGHRKGAFSGAFYDKKGLFEEVDGGTIFLDEIGEMPLNLQVKLLRVIQEGEFLKVGDNQLRHVDVRIIAATNRDLTKMIEDHLFREDLFFRLNVVPIILPPLRERREDIPLLVKYFLDEAIKRYARSKIELSKEIYNCFHQYSWPGNVRELKNLIERLVVLADGEWLSVDSLPDEIRHIRASTGKLPFVLPEEGIDLEELEKEVIHLALEKHHGNQTHTAKYLNITRNTLIYRMQKFNLG